MNQFHEIDKGLNKNSTEGAISGSRLESQFYRSYFEGALIAQGRHLLYSLGSLPSAQAFLKQMKPFEAVGYAPVARWYEAAILSDIRHE